MFPAHLSIIQFKSILDESANDIKHTLAMSDLNHVVRSHRIAATLASTMARLHSTAADEQA